MWNGAVVNVVVDGGTVASITPCSGEAAWTAIPRLWDWHCHLDKSFFGETWRSRLPSGTVWDHVVEEIRLRRSLSGSVAERAKRHLRLMAAAGTGWLRTHVDVGPEYGLANLDGVLEALEAFRSVIDAEIIAFPQHGLVRSQSKGLMREALRSGATGVGGLDPGGIDRAIDRSLDEVFDLATETGKVIDIHLHEPGELGLYTLSRIADFTRDSGFGGRVAVSHAYALGQVRGPALQATLDRIQEEDIRIVTAMPLFRPPLPLAEMLARGIAVGLGTDNVLDAWSPFGTGDVLERLSRTAEMLEWHDDSRLTDLLRLGGGRLPTVGESADFVLLPATNQAEAVARYPHPRVGVKAGRLVTGEDPAVAAAWTALVGTDA